MEFYSLAFAAFLALSLFCYYTIFRGHQWQCLLVVSLLFYLWIGRAQLLYVLATALSVWGAGLAMERTASRRGALHEDRKTAKRRVRRRKRLLLGTGLALNLGVLAALKYRNVFVPGEGLLLPLGISFYTFQSLSYLIDIYNEKYEAERSFLRFLLFVSWFPQLLQGPINRYDRLRPQFFGERHRISREQAGRAALLILFGFMKKYAVADMLSPNISVIFDGGISAVEGLPGSVIAFGILLYSAQQYCDFSGGIDMVLGISSLFGIDMMQNFRQPYFAVSLGDFWRRWHISLGAWMRDYVFYPFALLRPMQRFGKWASKHLGRHAGRALPAAVANLVVFFLVGIWHGAELHYILWGLYNGAVIALSDLLAPGFARLAGFLRLRTKSRGFHVFRVLRTFFIVNIGWYFDRIGDVPTALVCLRNTFLRFRAGSFGWGFGNTVLNQTGTTPAYALGALAVAGAVLVPVALCSVLRERGVDVCGRLLEGPALLRWSVCGVMLFLTLGSFMFVQNAGGFLYANF
ncbi:MBOAT family O-acyltransferase [Lachnoclostridium sp. Marseille-P6806]|uniref:MBOAT family O-acyltransferase n=1 Tax=Lachnoclostridium sp. Marseille-P6806 TaxID=2364793 RepID=UPI00103194F4|nr:MBOAT family O-acyltransferase [Lachnoclostridium sp. Marseille-P6806]